MRGLRDADAVFFDVDNTLYDFDASVRATLDHLRGAFADVLGHLDVDDLVIRYDAALTHLGWDNRVRLIHADPFLYRRATWALVLDRLDADPVPTTAPGADVDVDERKRSSGETDRGSVDVDALLRPADPRDLAGRLADAFAAWRFGNLRVAEYPGARATVDALLAAGKKVGIITNGPASLQRPKVRGLGYEDLLPPDMILVSGEFGVNKPDPSIFREAEKRANVPADRIAYVGDSVECDVPCKGVGMRSIFFDAARRPRPDFKSECGWEPDAVAHDYAEVARLLGV